MMLINAPVIRKAEKMTAGLFHFFALVLFAVSFAAISGADAALDSAKKDDRASVVAPVFTEIRQPNNWSAFFDSSRPVAEDWRQYAARDEVKPELQVPGRIVLESVRKPQNKPSAKQILLTLQARNIQVQANYSVSNAISAFAIEDNGELYLTMDISNINELTTLVATVYIEDDFRYLNPQYINLTAKATIYVAVVLGSISVIQPPRLYAAAGIPEIYQFSATGGKEPHTYILQNQRTGFAVISGVLSVGADAAMGEHHLTVEVTDAGSMITATVVATVEVETASTIMVDGGEAVFLSQGEMVSSASDFIFNPKSLSGIQVSAVAMATVALAARDNAWQITLYGGQASFAGVVDDSGDVVVAMSLTGDSDFVRGTDEKVSLEYVFSDEVVPVVPRGTRIFSRSYGGADYLVIDEGDADVLAQDAPANVNFLAFDDGRWNLNGVLLEEKPFALDDFMMTVSYRYIGVVGEMRANDGVAPSFSLSGDSDVFTVTSGAGCSMINGCRLLAIIEEQEEAILSVTVTAMDHLGDMLGYGYQNRMATVTAMVQVEPPLTLAGVGKRLTVTPRVTAVLHTVAAQYGTGDYTYSLSGYHTGLSGHFLIDRDSGVLSAGDDITMAPVYQKTSIYSPCR